MPSRNKVQEIKGQLLQAADMLAAGDATSLAYLDNKIAGTLKGMLEKIKPDEFQSILREVESNPQVRAINNFIGTLQEHHAIPDGWQL